MASAVAFSTTSNGAKPMGHPHIDKETIARVLRASGLDVDADSIDSIEIVSTEPIPGLEPLEVKIERDAEPSFTEVLRSLRPVGGDEPGFDGGDGDDFDVAPVLIDGDVIDGDQVNINIENLTINVVAE